MSQIKTYLTPVRIEDAVQMAHENESDFRFIAGGTDVMVNKFQGNDDTRCLIDITGVEEMRQIQKTGKNLKIGSVVSLEELTRHPEIAANAPWLSTAAAAIASPVIRKTATVGGNILCENRCIFYNQSAWWREAVGFCLKCEGDICIATGGAKKCFSRFVSDLAIPLISVNASVEVIEYGSSYITPLEDIYTGDGLKPHHFKKTSLIKSIHIPAPEGTKVIFKKLRKRESMEFSSLTTAVALQRTGKIKLVLGGVDPRPISVEGVATEKDELLSAVLKKARIVDNDVFSRDYRKKMISVFIQRSFHEIGLL
ncbi:MAG: FAD binding domain-containing protein [Bacteroidia bacterium]|nr:FAD binding domain-containing protein [Bacteroidia bacterium]